MKTLTTNDRDHGSLEVFNTDTGETTVFMGLSVALYSAHRQTQATQTTHNHHSKKPDRPAGPEGELVLLGMDGTVIAREVNLAPHALLTNSAADRPAGPEGEPVLLGMDGTVIAREVNLAPHALLTNSAADLFSASGPNESSWSS